MSRPLILLAVTATLIAAADTAPPVPPAAVTIPAADLPEARALLEASRDGKALVPAAGTTISGAAHQGDPVFVGWFRSAAADYVAATWKTEQGIHQRSVLHLKPSYHVVFDHVFATGNRRLERSITLPAAPAIAGPTATIAGTPAWIAQLVDGTAWDAGAGATLRNASEAAGPFSRDLVIACAVDGKPPTIEIIKAGNPLVRKLKLGFADGHADTLAMAWESRPLHLPDPATGKNVEHHGRAVCVRTTSSAPPVVITIP